MTGPGALPEAGEPLQEKTGRRQDGLQPLSRKEESREAGDLGGGGQSQFSQPTRSRAKL